MSVQCVQFCNLHNLKIAVYAREGVWVVGGQMQVRVSVQQVVSEFPGKSEEQEGSLLNSTALQ